MRGVISGAAAIQEAIEKGPKGVSKFLKLTDGESVTIRIVQELDETGKNYDEKFGLAVGYYEHMDPDTYMSFKCTQDEDGRCAGCERVPVNKKWRARGRLLMNVIVRNPDGDDTVKIFGTSLSSKGLAPTLVEFSNDYGSLCDRDYKLKRSGEGINTTYTLLPREATPLTKEDKALEVIDLTDVIRDLDYEGQVDLINGNTSKSDW